MAAGIIIHDLQEFYGVTYTCNAFVPSGNVYDVGGVNHACSAVGSVLGSNVVEGTTYIATAFQYTHGHKWRNVGISAFSESAYIT